MKRSIVHSMLLYAGVCLAGVTLAGCHSDDLANKPKAAQEEAIKEAINNPSAKKRAGMAKMDAILRSQQATGGAPVMPPMNTSNKQ
jgi:hypothetical protein